MATLLIKDIDEKVKQDFFAACVKTGSNMTAELKKFMKQYAEEKEAKK